MKAPLTLGLLQSWLFERVTESGAASLEPEELVVNAGLPAADRVEVYRHGYSARLVECLEDDYPALRHALGAAPFEQLCRAFIREHPPLSPSLNYYGAAFAAYCAERPERWSAPAAELAELEWAVVEAIHAEEGARLDVSALGRLSPEEWSRARLVPSPALRLLRLAYPVAGYYQAFQEGTALAEQWPAAEPSAVAVCRRAEDVWRVRMSPALGRLLASLIAGTPLLEALEQASATDASMADAAESDAAGSAPLAPEELQRAFQDWIACGMFAEVALAPDPA